MEEYTFFVTNQNMDGHDIQVNSLEELFDALKVAKDEWGENHIHVEMLKREEGQCNNQHVADIMIPFDQKGAKYVTNHF